MSCSKCGILVTEEIFVNRFVKKYIENTPEENTVSYECVEKCLKLPLIIQKVPIKFRKERLLTYETELQEECDKKNQFKIYDTKPLDQYKDKFLKIVHIGVCMESFPCQHYGIGLGTDGKYYEIYLCGTTTEGCPKIDSVIEIKKSFTS